MLSLYCVFLMADRDYDKTTFILAGMFLVIFYILKKKYWDKK